MNDIFVSGCCSLLCLCSSIKTELGKPVLILSTLFRSDRLSPSIGLLCCSFPIKHIRVENYYHIGPASRGWTRLSLYTSGLFNQCRYSSSPSNCALSERFPLLVFVQHLTGCELTLIMRVSEADWACFTWLRSKQRCVITWCVQVDFFLWIIPGNIM